MQQQNMFHKECKNKYDKRKLDHKKNVMRFQSVYNVSKKKFKYPI